MATKKNTSKTVATSKKAPAKKAAAKKVAAAPRRKVTASIAKAILKAKAAYEKQGYTRVIAALGRDFELSTVTINNVLTDKYNYLNA